MNDFFQLRVKELTEENSLLQEKLRSVNATLAEAEQVIKYYANPQVYELSPNEGATVLQDRLVGDREAASNSSMTRVAGLRARLYLKRYE